MVNITTSMSDEYTQSVITQDGNTALMRAAGNCESEAIVELVKAGANVNQQNNVCHCICRILAKYHILANMGDEFA